MRDTLDAPLDPSNANRYAYAGSDPVNNSDPSGRSATGAVVNGVVSGLGAVATAAACVYTAGVGCIVAGALIGAGAGEAAGIAQTAIEGGDDYGAAAGEGAISGGISGLLGGVGGKNDQALPSPSECLRRKARSW